MALTPWASLATLVKGKVQNALIFVKGVGENEVYPLEVDPTTGAIPVTVSGGLTPGGLAEVDQVAHSYASVNVTSLAWTQIIASTSAVSQQIYISDTGGYGMRLGVGGVGAEVDQLYLGPGFGGVINLRIAAGSRVSIRCLEVVTISAGYFIVSTLG